VSKGILGVPCGRLPYEEDSMSVGYEVVKEIKAASGKGPSMAFVKAHRPEIDACICHGDPSLDCRGLLNDRFRHEWVKKVSPCNRCWERYACNKVCQKGI